MRWSDSPPFAYSMTIWLIGPSISTSAEPSGVSKSSVRVSPSIVEPFTAAVPDGVMVTGTGLPAASYAVIVTMSSKEPATPVLSPVVPVSMSFSRNDTFCTLLV